MTKPNLYTLIHVQIKPKNGILRRTSPIFHPVTFLVAFRIGLVAFGVDLVAPSILGGV